MKREHLIEKLISFVITAAIIVPCDNETIRTVYVILGQGHFLITYLYQFKARRIGLQYLTSYAIVWFCLFAGYHFLNNPKILEIATGAYFIFHFLVDERHLLGHDPSPNAALDMIPFFLLNTAFLWDVHYQLNTLPTLCVLSSVWVVWREYVRISQRRPFTAGHGYFLFGTIFSIVMLNFGLEHSSLAPSYTIGALVIYHYSNWYIHYFFVFRKRGTGMGAYLANVLSINFVVIGAALWRLADAPGARQLDLFFTIDNFYLWTLLHLMFTTRSKDFRYWSSSPRVAVAS